MDTTSHTQRRSEAQCFRVELLVELSGGTGVTQEISVSEVFFVTNHLFPPGEPIELALVFEYVDPNYPVRLRCRGQVVRAEQRDEKVGVVVAIEAFRFEMHE
jgi:hypothetical protein